MPVWRGLPHRVKVLNFAPHDSGGANCVIPMDPYAKLALGVLMPMLFLAQLAVTMGIYWIYWKLKVAPVNDPVTVRVRACIRQPVADS